MPAPLIVLIIVLPLAVVFFFGFILYAYHATFKRKKRSVDASRDLGIDMFGVDLSALSEELRNLPYEEVKITSYDGLTLVGRYYRRYEGAPVHLLFHGYGSSPVHDFSASSMRGLYDGDNFLMVYQRAHGKSEGRSITFGYKESRDAVSWANYLVEREGEDVRIILGGVSMGGATVLMASALDLPKNVRCAIADCPYSTAKEAIMLTSGRLGFPPSLVYPFIRLSGRMFAGFDPNLASPVASVKDAKIPLLVIQGEADRVVPREMGDAIFEARADGMEYYTFPDADHGMSCVVDLERYKKIVREFIAKYI